LLLLTQHALLCSYLLNMYYFVTTISTCIALLLLTQHVLLCYYYLNMLLVATKQCMLSW
jgi:hypothetical protein